LYLVVSHTLFVFDDLDSFGECSDTYFLECTKLLLVWCFAHDQTWVMSFGHKDHSATKINVIFTTFYQHDLPHWCWPQSASQGNAYQVSLFFPPSYVFHSFSAKNVQLLLKEGTITLHFLVQKLCKVLLHESWFFFSFSDMFTWLHTYVSMDSWTLIM
jgi:hypothetical protein